MTALPRTPETGAEPRAADGDTDPDRGRDASASEAMPSDVSSPPPKLRTMALTTGEPATLVAFDGTYVEALTPRAFAPGARALFRLGFDDAELPLDVKCHGSKRTPEGAFLVRGRVISLPRDTRERLLGAVAIVVNR